MKERKVYSREDKSQFLNDIESWLSTFMLRCIRLFKALPDSFESQHFGRQLVRSSSSAAANFRAVRRGRSQKEYYAKISIVIEELDESLFWLETLVSTGTLPESRLEELIDEGYQVLKF